MPLRQATRGDGDGFAMSAQGTKTGTESENEIGTRAAEAGMTGMTTETRSRSEAASAICGDQIHRGERAVMPTLTDSAIRPNGIPVIASASATETETEAEAEAATETVCGMSGGNGDDDIHQRTT